MSGSLSLGSKAWLYRIFFSFYDPLQTCKTRCLCPTPSLKPIAPLTASPAPASATCRSRLKLTWFPPSMQTTLLTDRRVNNCRNVLNGGIVRNANNDNDNGSGKKWLVQIIPLLSSDQTMIGKEKKSGGCLN